MRRIVLAGMLMAGVAAPAAEQWMSLGGEWRFALDPKNEGVANQWFQAPLADRIQLPGTTDENRKGTLNEARETGRLTRLYPYVGAAWYQRDVEISPAWAGKRVVLLLERTKTSRLWVGSNAVGERNSLVAPHLYALGSLAPGRHQLTVRINNAEHPPIGDPHQISDQTQTNWNGVIGKLGLRVTDPVWIEDVQVYPDRAARKVRVRVEVGNATGKPAAGTLALAGSFHAFSITGERAIVEFDYALGEGVHEWDEFSPALHHLSVALESGSYRDRREVTFGLREFTARGSQFRINGESVFLRGNVDNCVFPLTGYPPMAVDGWLRVFKITKSYGLNHVRFHSWCPPEAAFEAADQLGVYLQPELPNWMAFGEQVHDDFLRAEGERILRSFGNHPSFVMLSLGNELGGKQELMVPFVKHFRALDGRHLYAQGTNNWFPNAAVGDDYWASFQVRGKKVRASFATVDPPLGHVQTGPPSTLKDYASEIAGIQVPVVSHEIGEYQVAPDPRELVKYTGVLRARNLEAFFARLNQSGMLHQADDFLRASGALAVLCYREDIEAALRTRGFGGFQLLDLVDFPGQGTALVGVLNAFMESKGLIEPAKWREFCSETVPLVRMAKFTWTVGETFTAAAEVAHYGPSAIAATAPLWTLRDSQGRTLASGSLPAKPIPQGSLTSLGEIRIPLKEIPAPAKLKLELALQGAVVRNSYDIWVYPEAVATAPGKVLISRTLDAAALQALASGGTVLLLPEPAALPKSIGGSFAPDFWNYGMFRKFAEERRMPVAPGTLGILCDPKHPALSRFPTESHSNWQWFHLLQNSRALILDSMPAGFRPIVQVIDNFERAHKLGVLFEARVGPGNLVVCSIDLPRLRDHPEARQFLDSLLEYMNSGLFAPSTALDEAAVRRILQ
jgi:Glycosyl hydrolases family 2, sugar binding domain